jgi:molybdenum cofactor cytidylyltransferase
VVVASHGHGELEALEWALSRRAAYVGLVCSRRRHVAVSDALLARGVEASLVASVDGPAGLDIGARGPEEVALSVLAEIVRRRRGAPLPTAVSGQAPGAARSAAAVDAAAVDAAAVDAAAVDAAAVDAAAVDAAAVDAAAVEAEPSCCGAEREVAARAPQSAAVEPSCCGAEREVAARAPQTAEVEPSCCGAARGAGPRPTFCAVVLAAGLSRRMGQPNKLLLPVDGQPMIRRSLEAVLGSGVERVLVVLGHDAEAVAQAIAPLGVRTVHNPAFASGQVSSVRAGLAALGEPADAVMVCLGDQPLLDARDLERLQRAFAERPGGDVLVPTHRGERGNPVVLGWSVVRETLARGANFGCRRFLDENSERVFFWDSGSEHFVRDVDRPADYQQLSSALSV